ncbi:arginase family protein [uncultured Microbacterium sp.]|uniref:arginase family protein n=1 Tax=uncultured Microbacterium sp. TaxID=191216 RepID=UPI0025F2E852|nr:arginase family protein [uncultured Microbacterium sp.]
MPRFYIVPQWQGSPFPRAMALIDGAEAIAGDLPRAGCLVVEVPLEAGDALGTGIHRLSALQRTADTLSQALADHDDSGPHPVVIGGDCGIAVPGIRRAAARDSLAVVWLDAHGDLHDEHSSASGAFAGMALGAVLGHGSDSPGGLALPAGLVPPEHAVLAGARDLDLPETLRAEELTRVSPAEIAENAHALADAAGATGASHVWVHVDLDVLDPSEITGVAGPVPFGVAASDLVAALKSLRERMPIAGASLAGFAPASPAAAVDDLGTILRIIGALA